MIKPTNRANLVCGHLCEQMWRQAGLSKATLEISYCIFSGNYTGINSKIYSGITQEFALGFTLLFIQDFLQDILWE